MISKLISHHAEIHFGMLALSFCGLALWEDVAAKRQPSQSLRQRWLTNFGIGTIGLALIYALVPIYGLAVAIWAEDNNWGAFNLIDLPVWLECVAAVLVLDWVLWGQHRLLHQFGFLWRIHSIHHSDRDFDITTGLRFHPLEMLYTTLILSAVIVMIGAPPVAVLFHLTVLVFISYFDHANVNIPPNVERRLRWVFVTPDFHRIHHSELRDEQQSNFSPGLFSFWDRIAGSYREAPRHGPIAMTLGLSDLQSPEQLRLSSLLLQPFRSTRPPATRATAARSRG